MFYRPNPFCSFGRLDYHALKTPLMAILVIITVMVTVIVMGLFGSFDLGQKGFGIRFENG